MIEEEPHIKLLKVRCQLRLELKNDWNLSSTIHPLIIKYQRTGEVGETENSSLLENDENLDRDNSDSRMKEVRISGIQEPIKPSSNDEDISTKSKAPQRNIKAKLELGRTEQRDDFSVIPLRDFQEYLAKCIQEAQISGELNMNRINDFLKNKTFHPHIANNHVVMDMLVDQMLQKDVLGRRSTNRPNGKITSLHVLCKLLLSKGARGILIQNGVVDQLLEKLHDLVSSSILSYLEESILILKSILATVKNSRVIAEKLVLHIYFLADVTKLLNLRNFKVLKYVLLVLQSMCKSGVDRVFSKLAQEEFLHGLQYHTNAKNVVIQKESLNLLNLLASDINCQSSMFSCGMFHNIVLILSHFNYEFKYLALEIISKFIPSKDTAIDALVLKYGFDILTQFIVLKFSDVSTDLHAETQRHIWKGIQFYSLHILAYLSDYNRIHAGLLQQHVLNQVTSYLIDTNKRIQEPDSDSPSTNFLILRSELSERTFLSCLMFSNLSKFKTGQQLLYVRGEPQCVLAQTLRVLEITLELHRQIPTIEIPTISNLIISKEEYLLLPKVVSRTIANMSAYEECHSFMLRSGVIDMLVGSIQSINERTVIWNCLCTISNLCDTNQECSNSVHELYVMKPHLRECLMSFILQKEDAKLQSRVMRILGKLSRSQKTLGSILTMFSFEKVVQFIDENHLTDVKNEGVRILTNCLTHFPQTEEKKLLDSNLVEIAIQLTYNSDSALVGDVCRLIYQISQLSRPICHALLEAGALRRLCQLKEASVTDKIRKYSALALKNIQ